MNPKICAYALGHLNHQIQVNRVSACFRCVAKLGDHTTQVLSEIKNSPEAKEHRLTLMRGEWPEGCGSCRDFELHGLQSTRLEGLATPALGLDLNNYDSHTGEIKHVKSIELRFNNVCNLACRHCSPTHSSRWESIVNNDPTLWKTVLGKHQEDPDQGVRTEYINDILENLVPNLEHITFSGGETLFQIEHYKFITAIPEEHAKHIKLMYVTNGTIVNFKNYNILELWKKFKSVAVTISADGVLDRFDYFRQGAKWSTVEQNMRIFRDAGCWVSTEITCSAYQMFYLTETVDYLYDQGITQWITSAIVQHPPLLNPRIIPTDVKQELLEKWNAYTASISDTRKSKIVKLVGNYPINYMLGDNSEMPYDFPYNKIPTWEDFAESVYTADRLFNKNVADYMPLLAEKLPKPSFR